MFSEYASINPFASRMDARIKIFCMVLVSVVVILGNGAVLVALSGGCLILSKLIRIHVRHVLRNMICLGAMLGVIFLTRSLTLSFSWPLTISWDAAGAVDGLLTCWRLVLLMFFGLLWLAVTSHADIRAAVAWFCKPLPGIPEKRVATMMSLTLRFLPLIMDQAAAMSEAQQSRCIQNRRNPVYRFTKFSMPLLCRTLETADRLADAMESRCYSDNYRTPETENRK